ncbi:PIN domain-containing protein [Halobellus sp. H-GB7]|uniref:type II toxin-antitoxin system VapC family toxin n=1 Tax=Halobellus sp. H-GB7 TaxID=3069756 RepID=UPI0027B08200|nr:PIN domain-containing protein [Halobellus sp. H-GB7]MDQ2054314.1 PIN domain-containing protein [Halobellus sp. H-GB7]
MSSGYVFDTEAIIAFLYSEPGHDTVADLLTDVFAGGVPGRIAEANASEIFYLIARFEGTDEGKPTKESLREADRDLRALERRGLQIDRADWRVAGEIKADGHISLADAHAVTLAHEQNATLVVGADDDFDNLPVTVDLLQFRNDSV